MAENTTNVYENCSDLPFLNIFYIVGGVIIVIENVLMAVVIIRTPRLHSMANIFVTSLAVADAIVGFINVLTGVFFIIVTPGDWIFIKVITAFYVCYMGSTMGAYLHITIIAIDRYLYIVHPFVYFKYVNQRLAVTVLLALWILMSVYMLTVAIILTEKPVCFVNDFMHLNIAYIDRCISMFILSVTFLAYFRIAALSLKHRQSIASVNVAVLSSSANASQQENVRTGLSGDSWRHKWTTMRFYLVMTGSIAVMIFPMTICTFISGFDVKIDDNVLNVFYLLPTLQSGFNVFINIFLNSDFKQAVYNLFLCRIVS
ncbi:hypothetical protein BsWGS_21892 [Bradybaena similaris]